MDCETDLTVYYVSIKTAGDKVAATTKADIFIQLVGPNGSETEWTKLTRFWRRFFRQGNLDVFDLMLKDVGQPIIVRLKLERWGIAVDVWGCDYVTVDYKGSTNEFPVYDYIAESVNIVSGKATLPQKVTNENIRKARHDEKSRSEDMYHWVRLTEAQSKNWKRSRHMGVDCYDDVPVMLKHDDESLRESKLIWKEIRMNTFLQRFKALFVGIKDLNDYNGLHRKLEWDMPTFLENWNDDHEFGRQMLNGTSKSIKRCKALPHYCKVTNELVGELLDEEKTLDEEVVKGRIFIVDLSVITSGVARSDQCGRGGLHCADATALFYSSAAKAGRFFPIAIQLEPGNEESIFTPKDEKYDWLLAKMHFRCADYNVCEFVTHASAHDAMEPIAIALFRCLPRAHPVYKLLRPHLCLVIAANQCERDFLFKRNVVGIYRSQDATEQMNKGHKHFDFDDLFFPKKMEKKGLMDSAVLPNYPFRDDALLYWEAIDSFVVKVLGRYYKSDDDVSDDYEIQNWINEIVVEGFTYDDDMTTKCPRNFKAVRDLQSFVTMVIFTTSVYHASVHSPQYQMYKFIPNAPGGMRLPIHKKGEGSLQRILDSLPNVEMSTLQLGVSYSAVRFGKEEALLGQYPLRLFVEPEIQTFMDEFATDLKKIGDKIRERNTKTTVPYEYLLPERIPATITS